MDPFDQQRRSLLVAFAGLGIDPLLPQLPAAAQPGAQRGYVLGPAEGEHLVQVATAGTFLLRSAPQRDPAISPWGPNR